MAEPSSGLVWTDFPLPSRPVLDYPRLAPVIHPVFRPQPRRFPVTAGTAAAVCRIAFWSVPHPLTVFFLLHY